MSTRVSILSAIPFYSFPLLLLSLIIPSRSLVSEFNPPLYSYTASNPSRKFSSFTFLSLREKSCYQDYCYDIDTREKSMDLEGAYGLSRGGILEFRRVIRDDTLARSWWEKSWHLVTRPSAFNATPVSRSMLDVASRTLHQYVDSPRRGNHWNVKTYRDSRS